METCIRNKSYGKYSKKFRIQLPSVPAHFFQNKAYVKVRGDHFQHVVLQSVKLYCTYYVWKCKAINLVKHLISVFS